MGTTVTAEIDPADAEMEIAVNAVVDATPVVDDEPTMDPQVLWAFVTDIAQNVMPYREIATRFGFVDVPQLRGFLVAHDAIRRKIKELRAIYESDDNVVEKTRKLAAHAVLQALPGTARIMLNPREPAPTRLDALKEHAKIAGVGYAPALNAAAGGGPGRFSVNIMFTNAGKTETITTIEHVPEPERGFGPKEEAS